MILHWLLFESNHGSVLLPFLHHASRTTGNRVSDLKIAHSVHHVDRELIVIVSGMRHSK